MEAGARGGGWRRRLGGRRGLDRGGTAAAGRRHMRGRGGDRVRLPRALLPRGSSGATARAAALRALAAGQRRNGYVRAACHQLAHRVGREAGTLHGIDALADGQSVCASGYYHGVLQSVMGKVGPRAARCATPARSARRRARPPRASDEHYNCVHGMGHGFMEVSSNSVFASLDGCRALRRPLGAGRVLGRRLHGERDGDRQPPPAVAVAAPERAAVPVHGAVAAVLGAVLRLAGHVRAVRQRQRLPRGVRAVRRAAGGRARARATADSAATRCSRASS